MNYFPKIQNFGHLPSVCRRFSTRTNHTVIFAALEGGSSSIIFQRRKPPSKKTPCIEKYEPIKSHRFRFDGFGFRFRTYKRKTSARGRRRRRGFGRRGCVSLRRWSKHWAFIGLMARMVKESAKNKARLHADIDFIDIASHAETLQVRGEPMMYQLSIVPAYALTIHKC